MSRLLIFFLLSLNIPSLFSYGSYALQVSYLFSSKQKAEEEKKFKLAKEEKALKNIFEEANCWLSIPFPRFLEGYGKDIIVGKHNSYSISFYDLLVLENEFYEKEINIIDFSGSQSELDYFSAKGRIVTKMRRKIENIKEDFYRPALKIIKLQGQKSPQKEINKLKRETQNKIKEELKKIDSLFCIRKEWARKKLFSAFIS